MFKYTRLPTPDVGVTAEDIEMQINELHSMAVLLDNLAGDCLPGGTPELNAVAYAIVEIKRRAGALVEAYRIARANTPPTLQVVG